MISERLDKSIIVVAPINVAYRAILSFLSYFFQKSSFPFCRNVLFRCLSFPGMVQVGFPTSCSASYLGLICFSSLHHQATAAEA